MASVTNIRYAAASRISNMILRGHKKCPKRKCPKKVPQSHCIACGFHCSVLQCSDYTLQDRVSSVLLMRVVIHTSGTTRLCPHCTRALLANINMMRIVASCNTIIIMVQCLHNIRRILLYRAEDDILFTMTLVAYQPDCPNHFEILANF